MHTNWTPADLPSRWMPLSGIAADSLDDALSAGILTVEEVAGLEEVYLTHADLTVPF